MSGSSYLRMPQTISFNTDSAKLNELKSKRDALNSEISDLKSQKQEDPNSKELESAKQTAESAKSEYDAAVQAQNSESGEAELQAMQSEKSAIDTQYQSQQSVVSGLESSVSSAQSAVNTISSELSSLQPPSESSYKNEDGTTNTAAYQQAMQQYNSQKAALTTQLNAANSTLRTLQSQLDGAKSTLSSLEQQKSQMDSIVSQKEQEVNAKKQQLQQDVQTKQQAYQEAQNEVQRLQSAAPEGNNEIDNQISQKEQELASIEQQISQEESQSKTDEQKKAEEKEEEKKAKEEEKAQKELEKELKNKDLNETEAEKKLTNKDIDNQTAEDILNKKAKEGEEYKALDADEQVEFLKASSLYEEGGDYSVQYTTADDGTKNVYFTKNNDDGTTEYLKVISNGKDGEDPKIVHTVVGTTSDKASTKVYDSEELEENSSKSDLAAKQKLESINDEGYEIENTMLSDIKAELEKQKEEIETEADSKTGLGALWDSAKGLFGKGTSGQLNDNSDLMETLEKLENNPDPTKIQELYKSVFNQEPDLEAIKESIDSAKELEEGSLTLDDGTQLNKDEIADMIAEQAASLANSFEEQVDSQGLITKGISCINNVVGIGTTENMTTAQIENYKDMANQLKSADSPEEFASLYKSITGEELSKDSIKELNEGASKVENSKASESIMDYEETNETIKNTAVAVAVGVATATTGPLGAVAIGMAATAGINAVDAVTQDNGKNIGDNLVTYVKEDLVKDLCVGALNGLTGKLGNVAGQKVAGAIASKTAGNAITNQVASKIMSATQRTAIEFVDGAVDAGLSSAGEYVISSAAGENGNFLNEEGNIIDADGNLSFINNLKENFDAKEMAEQVTLSTLMGGAMSVGMQETVGAISKGISKTDILNKKIDTDLNIKDTDLNIKDIDFNIKDKDLNIKISDVIETGKDHVSSFSSLTDAKMNAEIGEVFQIADSKNVGIKLKNGEIEELKISKKTYNELFPDGADMNISQQKIGDCYLVSSLYSLMENPKTRADVLRCFTEDAAGNITCKLPDSSVEFTLGTCDLTSDYVNQSKIVKGSEGARMLEYTYGLNLLQDGQNYIQDRLSFWINPFNSTNKELSLLYDILYTGDTDITLNKLNETAKKHNIDNYDFNKIANIDKKTQTAIIDYNKVRECISSNETKINSEIQKLQNDLVDLANGTIKEETLRNYGGWNNDVYSNFGFKNSGFVNINSFDAKNLLLNSDNWDNYVFGLCSKSGKSDQYFINKKLDIAYGHAYSLKPIRTDATKSGIAFKVTNPWHTNQHQILTFNQLEQYFSGIFYAKID